MKKKSIAVLSLTVLAGSIAIAASQHSSPFEPGALHPMLAHNAYPDEGKYGDRLDHAISAGVPSLLKRTLCGWMAGP